MLSTDRRGMQSKLTGLLKFLLACASRTGLVLFRSAIIISPTLSNTINRIKPHYHISLSISTAFSVGCETWPDVGENNLT